MGGQASEGVKGARANYIRIVLVNREMRKQGTVTLVLTNNVDGLAAAYSPGRWRRKPKIKRHSPNQ